MSASDRDRARPEGDVRVAFGGTIKRTDRCPECGEGEMLFRVDENEQVIGKFCGNFSCSRWCKEEPCD